MAVGHFKLDGREYMLPNQGALTRSNANQVAAKIGSGAGDYDDLQDWNAWLMDEWRAGVGKKDPETDGFLFAHVDTRFKQQMFLPPYMSFLAGAANSLVTPASTASLAAGATKTTITIGSGETYTQLATQFQLEINETWSYAEILLDSSDTTVVTVSVYDSDSGSPGSLVDTVDITPTGEIGFHFYLAEFSEITAAGTEEYFLVIEPASGTIDIPTVTATNSRNFSFNGSTWTSNTTGFIGRWHTNRIPGSISHAAFFNNAYWFASGTGLYRWAATGYALVYNAAATITCLFPMADYMYIGLGDSNNYVRIDTSSSVTSGGTPGRLFTMHNGYLFRAVAGDLYYSSDASAWEGPFQVSFGSFLIRGIAGLNTDLIVSCDNALYRFVPGDVVYSITTWGDTLTTNGKFMVNFQGQLYISQGESIIRFDGETLLSYGPDLEEGLPSSFSGDIVGIVSNNNWLVCAVAGTTPTVWAHNGQGWHSIGRLPENLTLTTMGIRPSAANLSSILLGSSVGVVNAVVLPNTQASVKNVVDDGYASYFHYTGWIETNWFYGSLREVNKDFESVYVDGENISSARYADVYWQDEDSTDWEYLGQITASTQELRWSNYANRPNSRRIKIALSLHNSFTLDSPIVTAIRIKYMPMIRDRWRWQIPVWVSNQQQMVDGDINPYNAAQMRLHLDALTKQVPPFIFEDPEGTQYEVKIMNASQQLTRVDWMQETLSFDTQYVYNLVVEQVIADEYSA